MNNINLRDLGTNYNVVNEDNHLIKTVKVISSKDILPSNIGLFDGSVSFDDYIEKAKNALSGFVDDPYSVYWHTTPHGELEMSDVIDICVLERYEYAIIELISEKDIDRVELG